MSITDDILASYRHPRRVIRNKLNAGPREDRVLAVLMAACFLIFVAQWPILSRAAYLDPSKPLEARMTAALLGLIFILPLIAYGVAGASHLLARAFGGKGSHYGARLALFWALLSAAPLLLLNGLAQGFLGSTPATVVLGILVLVIFLFMWASMLIEVEQA
jgi:hypothetical protein